MAVILLDKSVHNALWGSESWEISAHPSDPSVIADGEVCIRDAAAAVAWTLENIVRYGGDPKKVYVSGISAGGYLTMMVGMAPQYLKELGHNIGELAGLAPVSGQATKHFNIRKFAGDTDPQFLPKIDSLAPLAYCSKDIPFADHGRTFAAGIPYVEMFVQGRIPTALRVK